jgi:hypothetical protein
MFCSKHVDVKRHFIVDLKRHSIVYLKRHSIVDLKQHSIVDLKRHSIVDLNRHSIVDFKRHSIVDLKRHSMYFSEIKKTFAVSSLVSNLLASQIGDFFLPHPVDPTKQLLQIKC